MKTRLKLVTGLLVLAAATAGGALAMQRSTSVQRYLSEHKLAAVLADYTDKTVIATLTRLVQDIEALDAAARKLRETPSDDGIVAAAESWRAARATWKQAAAFLYGPAAQYDFDKQLSTWPMDQVLVDHTLGEMAEGRLTLDARYLRNRVHSAHRGFMAAEYLLFRDGKPRKLADMRPVERDYLATATEVMVLEATDFLAAWAGTGNLKPAWAERLAANGFKPRKSYADEFKKPGTAESRYPSFSVPLQELFQDSADTADETCAVIEEVLGSDDPRDSDTWFSNNALADIQNTIKSVENSYLGGLPGNRGASASDLVAARNSIMDRQIRIALADTAYRITQAGDPYAPHGPERDLALRVAAAACHKLVDRLNEATPLVVMHPTTRPWAAYGVEE